MRATGTVSMPKPLRVGRQAWPKHKPRQNARVPERDGPLEVRGLRTHHPTAASASIETSHAEGKDIG